MHGRYHLPRLQKKIPSRPLGTQNHVSKRELVEIGKEETWQSRNCEPNKTKKPTPYLGTGVWKNKRKVSRVPSWNTQKLSPITTGIRKIQKQYFEFPPSSTQKLTPFDTGIRKIRTKIHDKLCSNLRKLNPFGGTRFRKYEQKYLTCPIQTYASGSSHEEEAGVHKHQQEEEEEDEEEAVRDDETVP